MKAKYVAAGINTAYAVTTDGYVYAWGNNENGMIGNGTSDKDEGKPHTCKSSRKNIYRCTCEPFKYRKNSSR